MLKPSFVLLVLLASMAARAECAMPSPYVLPRPGTPLPPNPTLYLFVPSGAGIESAAFVAGIRAVSTTGTALPLTVKTLKGGGALQVVRLGVTVPEGVSFRLDPDLRSFWPVKKGAATGGLEVKRGKDLESSWTCSYESSRVLDTSLAAPAYRIEFAQTEEALRAGQGDSVVVEGDDEAFGRSGAEPRKSVQLGHHNCWGTNLTWKSPQLAVRVTALLPDGTERKSESIFVLDAPPLWGRKP